MMISVAEYILSLLYVLRATQHAPFSRQNTLLLLGVTILTVFLSIIYIRRN